MSMMEIYKKVLRGEKFKSISDLQLHKLSIKKPQDLVANSPIMQDMIAKHWDMETKNEKI
jgi:hypothetical protein